MFINIGFVVNMIGLNVYDYLTPSSVTVDHTLNEK